MSKQTPVTEFISELNGGVFEQQLSALISDVAAGVMDHQKQGELVITLKMKRIDESHMVKVSHKFAHKTPTHNGFKTETNETSTPMHVGAGGKTTLFPESQVPTGQTHLADKTTGELVNGSINQGAQ